MVGAKFQISERACPVSPGTPLRARTDAGKCRTGSYRLRWIAILSAIVPLSFVLVQCGKAPNAGMLAANSQPSAGDTFDDRFPAPQFGDRFPTANESFVQLQSLDAPRKRAAQSGPAPTGLRRLRQRFPTSVRREKIRPLWSA